LALLLNIRFRNINRCRYFHVFCRCVC
jgi:hypothetical protein